jgi:hypothetical protein
MIRRAVEPIQIVQGDQPSLGGEPPATVDIGDLETVRGGLLETLRYLVFGPLPIPARVTNSPYPRYNRPFGVQ